jgi:hypothetical protein
MHIIYFILIPYASCFCGSASGGICDIFVLVNCNFKNLFLSSNQIRIPTIPQQYHILAYVGIFKSSAQKICFLRPGCASCRGGFLITVCQGRFT